jgi:hypothetical protein
MRIVYYESFISLDFSSFEIRESASVGGYEQYK